MWIARLVVLLSLGWCAVASAESYRPDGGPLPDVPYDAGPGMDAPPEPDAGMDAPPEPDAGMDATRTDTGVPALDAPVGMDAGSPAPSGGCSVGRGAGSAAWPLALALLALFRRSRR